MRAARLLAPQGARVLSRGLLSAVGSPLSAIAWANAGSNLQRAATLQRPGIFAVLGSTHPVHTASGTGAPALAAAAAVTSSSAIRFISGSLFRSWRGVPSAALSAVVPHSVLPGLARISSARPVHTAAPVALHSSLTSGRLTTLERAVLLECAASPVLEHTVSPVLECATSPVLERAAAPTLPVLERAALLERAASPVLERTVLPVLEYATSPVLEHVTAPTLPVLERAAAPVLPTLQRTAPPEVTVPERAALPELPGLHRAAPLELRGLQRIAASELSVMAYATPPGLGGAAPLGLECSRLPTAARTSTLALGSSGMTSSRSAWTGLPSTMPWFASARQFSTASSTRTLFVKREGDAGWAKMTSTALDVADLTEDIARALKLEVRTSAITLHLATDKAGGNVGDALDGTDSVHEALATAASSSVDGKVRIVVKVAGGPSTPVPGPRSSARTRLPPSP